MSRHRRKARAVAEARAEGMWAGVAEFVKMSPMPLDPAEILAALDEVGTHHGKPEDMPYVGSDSAWTYTDPTPVPTMSAEEAVQQHYAYPDFLTAYPKPLPAEEIRDMFLEAMAEEASVRPILTTIDFMNLCLGQRGKPTLQPYQVELLKQKFKEAQEADNGRR